MVATTARTSQTGLVQRFHGGAAIAMTRSGGGSPVVKEPVMNCGLPETGAGYISELLGVAILDAAESAVQLT